MNTTRSLATAACLAALLAFAGCGDSTPQVQQDDLEQEISSQLEEEVGQAPDDISCPGDLDGTEGEEMRCTLTAGADELGLTVTVTSVDGDDVKFDIQVDELDQGAE